MPHIANVWLNRHLEPARRLPTNRRPKAAAREINGDPSTFFLLLSEDKRR